MSWQEAGWGCGSCSLHGAPSSVWQHFRHGAVLWMNMAENTAWRRCCSVPPEQGQHETWLRPRRGEVRAPPGAGRACRCSEGAAAARRPPEPAALLGRHAGEEAQSLLRNAGWPQASALLSKEVLTFVSLRVQRAWAFFVVGGWWWGMRESWLVGVFKNTLEDNGEQGAKIFLCLRKIQFYLLPSHLSPAVRRHWAAFCLLLCSQAS